jgi:hypothetical protein
MYGIRRFIRAFLPHLEIQMPLDQDLLVRFGSFQYFIKVVDDVEVDSHGRRYQNFHGRNFFDVSHTTDIPTKLRRAILTSVDDQRRGATYSEFV